MQHRTLIVVCDGLRPDFITPEHMPHLAGLRASGIAATRHHAAAPTKTRVQAATIATGCRPGRHGLVENVIRLPGVDDEPIDTGDGERLLAIERDLDGGLLSATSLGERLAAAGQELLAVGSCSTGANVLCNHTQAGAGLANAAGLVVPPDQPATEAPVRPATRPNVARNAWAVDVVIEHVREPNTLPVVTVLWLSDPDKTMHRYGVGHDRTLAAVAHVDDQLGRLLDAFDRHGLADTTDLLVLGDHGFSTDGGSCDVPGGLDEEPFADRLTLVCAHVFGCEDDAALRGRTVERLLADDDVGAVFTRDGAADGTLALSTIGLDHPRAGAIVWFPDWSAAPNEHGFPGRTTRTGVGGHGTLSPYELRVELIAAGPSFKDGGRTSPVPTGHVDLVPTVMELQGLPVPADVDGRVLSELMADGPAPSSIDVATDVLTTSRGWALERIRCRGVEYVGPAMATESNVVE